MISILTTRKLARALRLKRATITICCLLLSIANLPKPVANQQQQQHWSQLQPQAQQPLIGERDHYQLIGAGDDETTAALAQQAVSSSAFSLADPIADAAASSLALAEMFNSLGDADHRLVDKQQTRGGATPGHYEFEVAPKMEPPSAPRPPFKQATTTCPGSDLFGGFSPRHTLCGDLYQGKVPLNPMGQLVNDQAYPFELIKNKTLQFLARSLPILKTEYEIIPKVARYVPAHQLLNPTAHFSPLGHEHFQTLNERSGFTRAPPPQFVQQQQRQRRRRRRRRSTHEISSRNQHQASITVAELMPNATLVVSSAHSSAGRIGGGGNNLAHHHLVRSAPETAGSHFTMITKDGYRPYGAVGMSRVRDSTMGHTSEDSASPVQRPVQQQQQPPPPTNTKDNAQQQSRSHAQSGEQISPSGQQVTQQGGAVASAAAANVGRGEGQTNLPAVKVASTTNSRHASPPPSVSAAESQPDQQTQGVVQARSASGDLETGSGQQDSSQRATSGQARQQSIGQAASSSSVPQSQQQQQQHLKCANVNGLLMYSVCQAASALIEGDSAPAWLQAAKQIGNLVAATSSADSYSSAAQNSNPLWALWSAFSSGGGGGGVDQSSAGDLAYKSSSGHHPISKAISPAASVASVINLLNPLMSFFAPSLQRAGTGDPHSIAAGPRVAARANQTTSSNQRNQAAATTGGGLSSNLKTMSNLLLTGLSIAGLYDWLGTTPLFSPTATTFARRKKPFEAGETFVDTPASLAALSATKQLTPGATSGLNSKQPPTPCPSLEEYISPTFARNYQGQWKYVVQIPHEGYFTQTIQRSSCVRQKCEFTEGVCHEAPRWVSLLVAEIYYPNVVFGNPAAGQQQQQQQGQTLASASASQLDALNQRVALDNNVPTANAQLMSQLMSTAPSNSHLQQVVAFGQQQQQQQHQAKSLTTNSQDPLQMTDSLNMYNHNNQLNNAFLNAANELGLDPTNFAQMQQLAQAHNYQLMQRNGLVPLPAHQAAQSHSHFNQQQQQPVTAESRVSLSNNNNNNNQATAGKQQQQRSQQVQQEQQQQQEPVFTNDYIKALALETIRQNPHLSIDDLIRSLQMQQAAGARRKKRDLSAQINQQNSHPHPQTMHHFSQSPVSQQQQQQFGAQQHLATRRSGGSQPAPQFGGGGGGGEQMVPSMNELSSTQAAHLAAAQQLDLAAAGQLSGQTSMGQQQQQQQAATTINNNQQQHNMIRTPAVEPHDHLFKQQQTSTTAAANQMIASQSTLMNDIAASTVNQHQQQAHASDAATNGSGQQQAAAAVSGADAGQAECDGHDKIGCYVVRVYYDWFLVNGSCKCWKTNNPSQTGSSSNTGGGGSGGGSSGSFIRRIFTG